MLTPSQALNCILVVVLFFVVTLWREDANTKNQALRALDSCVNGKGFILQRKGEELGILCAKAEEVPFSLSESFKVVLP
jgi:hypothetical protein